MSFSFQLSPRSPTQVSSNPPLIEHEYVAEGIDDSTVVHAAGLQYTPPAIASAQGTLYRQDVRVMKQGFGLFYVAVPYAPRAKSKFTWDYDTQGGTVNVKVSRQTIGRYVAAGQVERDHAGAIGRNLDGSVDGVDIVIPSMVINAQITHPYGVLTFQYASMIMDLTGYVNSDPIFGRQPGEVLFLGGRGSDGSESEAQAGYKFAVSKNLQNLVLGGISVAQKAGHDYAWVEFLATPVGGQAVTRPRQVNVERVYDRIDLAGILGLPRW
jgi:hypothetical protein